MIEVEFIYPQKLFHIQNCKKTLTSKHLFDKIEVIIACECMTLGCAYLKEIKGGVNFDAKIISSKIDY